MKFLSKIFLILWLVSLTTLGFSASYYIDYVGGDDTNNPNSIDAPWKHCPGDTNATDYALARKVSGLSPGDTVFFAGGVVYYGEIVNYSAGSIGNPITYDGDSWGTGQAILDGSAPVSGPWNVCPDAGSCFGNIDHYTNIYTATAPSGPTFYSPFYQNTEFLSLSQEPDPEDPFYYQNHSEFYKIPTDSATKEVALTYITDPDVFGQTDTSFWDDGVVLIYKSSDNTVAFATITSFDPDTDTVFFDSIGGAVGIVDGNWEYSITNNPSLIDNAGEFAFVGGTMYLWAFGTVDPDTVDIAVSVNDVGFDIRGQDYITVEGFHVRRYFTPVKNATNAAVGIDFQLDNGSRTEYSIVQNCRVSQLRSWSGGIEGACIQMKAADYCTVRGNTLENCQQNTGITVAGIHNQVTNNTITKTSGQGIYVSSNYNEISHNTISDINGTHSNGLSFYGTTTPPQVYVIENLAAHNVIYDCAHPLTTQYSQNLYVIGNLIDARGNTQNFDFWSGGMWQGTDNLIANNTFINNSDNNSIQSLGDYDILVVNNVIDGGGGLLAYPTRYNNAFVGWGYLQSKAILQTGELDLTEVALSTLFNDPTNYDYTPKIGSDLIDAGFNVTTYFPSDIFPDYNFYVDLAGNPIPASGNGIDIGAYQFVEETIPPAPPVKVIFWSGGMHVWKE